MNVDIDCRGMPCPQPIIALAQAVDAVNAGEEVRLAADDPAADVDVRAWCRMRGQTLVTSQTAPDGTPIFVVRREH